MNAVVPSGGLNVASEAAVNIFETEAGLVKALAVLRQAAIPPEARSQLRDWFLNYAGESDLEKRAALKDSILTELKKHSALSVLLPATSAASLLSGHTPPSQTSPLGYTRPAPAFSVNERPVPTPETSPAPAPVPPVPTAIESDTMVEAATSVEAIPSSTQTASNEATVPTSNIRGRIDAIKHDINSKVGNPVNLISADEKIGREYMSALLEAMKKVSQGGGPGTLARLETAYRAADALITAKGLAKTGSAASSTVETTQPKLKLRSETQETAAVPNPEPPLPKTAVSTPPTDASPIVLNQIVEVESPIPIVTPPPPPLIQSEGLYHRPADELEAPEHGQSSSGKRGLSSLAGRLFMSGEQSAPERSPAPQINVPKTPTVRKVNVRDETESMTNLTSDPVHSPTKSMSSPEKLEPLKHTSTTLPAQMAALKAEAAKRDEATKKPITDLNAPEIDEGLRQLLAEWSLFRKSGFLGTGPSGIDHPLYKQLSTLPMAAVVSGRFEGVTPEIKRLLSDYMTGWRYEQGIVHEMGETFEHYLRRVIRQILLKQRKIPGT